MAYEIKLFFLGSLVQSLLKCCSLNGGLVLIQNLKMMQPYFSLGNFNIQLMKKWKILAI